MTGDIRASAGTTTVRYDHESQTLTVARGEETLLTGRLSLSVGDVTLPWADEATVHTTEATPTDASASDRALVTHADGWETTVALDTGDGFVDVDVSATVPADVDSVELDDLTVLDDTSVTCFGRDASVYRHGYQSWTPTATLPVGESFPRETGAARPQMLDPAAPEDTSNYVTGLVDGDGDALTLGFLDHSRFVTRFDVDRGESGVAGLAAVCPGDGVTVEAGDRIELPTLRIDATRDLPTALGCIAEATAARMGARVPDEVPTGWCSWYHYFTGVTADDVRENVAALDDWDVPLSLVQLDDGYQTAFGDWLTLADGFEDLSGVVEDVRASGYRPGLWLAPFYVEADSDVAREHPDWLITRDGEPVDAGDRHGAMYALDTTHPGVEDWLRETFATIVDDWGFDYLKLDFLYAAALAGDRYADVTRAEAYRRGMETIREAVGDETFLLGCGAPQGPSVGLVDAMRVGPDTAPHWEASPASQPAHENAIRNVLNRQWTHRTWWLNDPDCQLVRETTDLTLAEQRSFAAVVALLGGSNVISDRVAEIEDAGRNLVERTLPPVETGRVEGVGEEAFPTRVVAERAADGGLAVAVFNWDDEPRTLRVDPASYGFDEAVSWDVFDESVHADVVEREVPVHGCLLVQVAPARDRPHLLGTEHLAGLTSQVAAVKWDGQACLTVELAADTPQEAVVATPGAWRLDGCSPGDDDRVLGTESDDSGTANDGLGTANDGLGTANDGLARVTLTPGANDLRFTSDTPR
ncbi:alpha-galactosidase [Haloarchaeobius sp. TZWWS8]|uniref:alpha-galactosidase n=1 Tax=Haloarchaeobius sp. TZWWS8 TaxID=3446121 RepID=UPI003EC05670